MEDAKVVKPKSIGSFFDTHKRSLKMAERLTVQLNLSVVTHDVADGSPFYSMSCPVRYDGMRYDQLVKLQQLVAQWGVQLSALGLEELKEKAAVAKKE
jgi:hypothetical protein